MAQRTRKYVVRYGGDNCGLYSTNGGTPNQLSVSAFPGTHSCADETHPGPPYRTGGPLLVTKKKVSICRFAPFHADYTAIPKARYDGFMFVNPYIPPDPVPMNLSGWGAKGWNRTYPTHPIYSMGVSLLELRDVERSVSSLRSVARGFSDLAFSKKKRTFGQFLSDLRKGSKYMADNYLNTQFGWIPFAQDLEAMVNYQENLRKKLLWLRRKNGKSIRRRVTLDAGGFSENIDRNVAPLSTCSPVFVSSLYSSGNSNSQPFPIVKNYDRKIWFVAKYRLWIPELAGVAPLLRDHTRLKAQLYGIDLDPSIIYKVIPWTWLLDWFFSVGAILQNIYLRAKMQVVAVYAYVMASEAYQYDAPGTVTMNQGTYPVVISSSPLVLGWSLPPRKMSGVSRTRYEFRQREVANPYGFGITFASLSAYQWSILVALGLSRGRKGLAPRA